MAFSHNRNPTSGSRAVTMLREGRRRARCPKLAPDIFAFIIKGGKTTTPPAMHWLYSSALSTLYNSWEACQIKKNLLRDLKSLGSYGVSFSSAKAESKLPYHIAGNLWPSQCCWTTSPTIPCHWPCWVWSPVTSAGQMAPHACRTGSQQGLHSKNWSQDST